MALNKLASTRSSDEALAARVGQGDSAALEALYDRHAPLILGMALKVTGDQAQAEEILQETFWQAWGRASTYRPQSEPLVRWLLRLARQIALDRNAASGLPLNED